MTAHEVLELPEGIEVGMSLADLEPAFNAQRFAFYSNKLRDAAVAMSMPWPIYLTRLVVAGLWEERFSSPTLATYTLYNTVHVVSLANKKPKMPERFHKVVSMSPAYMECGLDAVPVRMLRPIALWRPPCTMLAYWPPGLEGETKGPRVVDGGTMVGYFSYPQSDHGSAARVSASGPDYAIIPEEALTRFDLNGREYIHENRWGTLAVVE